MKLHVEVLASRALRFGDGSPVRAASGVAHFGDGWLVVQDDATHGAWCRPGGIEPIRIVEAVQGHDHFSSAAGTKHLKPDFEAAVDLDDQDRGQVVVFGSGSTGARMQAALVTLHQGSWRTTVADLGELYGAVARELGVALAELNLEGACIVGSRLRWFNRGNLRGDWRREGRG